MEGKNRPRSVGRTDGEGGGGGKERVNARDRKKIVADGRRISSRGGESIEIYGGRNRSRHRQTQTPSSRRPPTAHSTRHKGRAEELVVAERIFIRVKRGGRGGVFYSYSTEGTALMQKRRKGKSCYPPSPPTHANKNTA